MTSYDLINKQRIPFPFKDFIEDKREKIMRNLINKIEVAEKGRGIVVHYRKEYDSGKKRNYIKEATLKSKDGVIEGKIKYMDTEDLSKGLIKAKIKFNSNDESDRPSYNGLIEILNSSKFKEAS